MAAKRYWEEVKPALKRCIPAPVRHYAKEQALHYSMGKVSREEILPYDKDAYSYGINLIGPIDSATGLGQSFRLTEHTIADLGRPYLIRNFNLNMTDKASIEPYEDKLSENLKYSVNLWHINPPEFIRAYRLLGKQAFDKRYNVAFWLWEMEEFPDEWVPLIRLLDEVWTPSEFISRGIRKKTNKPVHTVPYWVTAEADTAKYGREYFGLPTDRFLFLTMYDSRSVKARKNPEGAIRAFQRAFAPGQQEVGLVIKAGSAGERELNEIKQLAGSYKNVYLITQSMEKIQVNSLTACADAFVSLHRAEGFGLVMAEAMLNHTPVIATAWSSNVEFMDPDTACMVPCRMQTLGKDLPPYKKGNRWAEPDIGKAAEYMKRLFQDRTYREELAKRAYSSAAAVLGRDRIKDIMELRLKDIEGKMYQ